MIGSLEGLVAEQRRAPTSLGVTVFAMLPGQDMRLGIAYGVQAWDALVQCAIEMGAVGVSQHGRGTRNPVSGEMGFSENEVAHYRDYLWQ